MKIDWNEIDVHPRDLLGWIDVKTGETIYLMDKDGDFILSPVDDDVISEVIRKGD